MPTYSSADINTKPIQNGEGHAVVYDGSASTGAVAAATGDILRLMRVPAGTRLCEVSIRVTAAAAATAPSSLRLSPVDGTAATELVAAGDTVLATANKKDMNFAPVTVAKDSFLELLLGTLVTPTPAAVTATALGMGLGAK